MKIGTLILVLCLAAGIAPAATVVTIPAWSTTLPSGEVLSLTGGTVTAGSILFLTATADTRLFGSPSTPLQLIPLSATVDGIPTTITLFSRWTNGVGMGDWLVSFDWSGQEPTHFPTGQYTYSYLESNTASPLTPLGMVQTATLGVKIANGTLPIPEPATFAFVGIGLVAAVWRVRSSSR